MRKIVTLLLFLIVASGFRSANAQDDRNMGLEMGGIPQPAAAALAYSDSLDLSEAQISKLRRVVERIEQAGMSMLMLHAADSVDVWEMWTVAPIDSAAMDRKARDKASKEVPFVLALMRARDDAFEILRPDQLAQLNRIIRKKFGPTRSSERRIRPCTTGNSGGSAKLSDSVELLWSLTFRGDSAEIQTIFVAKADDKLYNDGTAADRRTPPSASERISGGTSGRWWLGYDDKLGVAWVDSQKVSLEQGNVVLVQGVDRLRTPPTVVGTVRVPSRFYTGGCQNQSARDFAKEHVLRSPAVRKFIESTR